MLRASFVTANKLKITVYAMTEILSAIREKLRRKKKAVNNQECTITRKKKCQLLKCKSVVQKRKRVNIL